MRDGIVKERRPPRKQNNRKNVVCAMCEKFPCFKGIETMSSNLAETCQKFKKIK